MTTELILVDDDKILLIVLEKMIRTVRKDLQISSFISGKQALDYLSENPGSKESGSILIDINLRDMNAWEFIDQLEAAKDACPKIILMTSSVSSVNSERAKKHIAVTGFFEKPITFENVHQIFQMLD